MRFPLRLVKNNPNIDFMGKRYFTYLFSGLVTLVTIFLLFSKGLNFGIDFTGGIILEVQLKKEISLDNFRSKLGNLGYLGASIQKDGTGGLIIRIQQKEDGDHSEEVSNIKQAVESIAEDKVEFRRVDYVGPKVGSSLILKGIYSMVIALVAIMVYVWIRFDLYFGMGVIVALFHDLIATVGFYIVSGYEFDLTSIAAILTIIGYSVNDSVVIYDRIRENIRKRGRKDIKNLINDSINETLSRTVMTALTTLAVCVALVLFGGQAIEGFSAAMLFGIAFGTYSSICISAPVILLFIEKKN